MTDFYEILGVDRAAENSEIKKAYKKLSGKYHPDKKTGDEEKFKEIKLAYETLMDKEKRKYYDQHGKANTNNQNPNQVAMNKIMQHAQGWLAAGNIMIDMVEHIKKHILMERNNQNQQMQNAATTKTLIEKATENLKCDEENFFLGFFQSKLDEIARFNEQAEFNLAALDEADNIMKHFSWEQIISGQLQYTTGYTSATTGGW